MPRLIPSSKILRNSVSFVPRTFDSKPAKTKEARIHVYFPVASSAGNRFQITRPHALGFAPTSFSVSRLERDIAAGPPGTVFTIQPWATSTMVTFHCSTANTWAEIVIR